MAPHQLKRKGFMFYATVVVLVLLCAALSGEASHE